MIKLIVKLLRKLFRIKPKRKLYTYTVFCKVIIDGDEFPLAWDMTSEKEDLSSADVYWGFKIGCLNDFVSSDTLDGFSYFQIVVNERLDEINYATEEELVRDLQIVQELKEEQIHAEEV